MPLYSYKCVYCKHQFEKLSKMAERHFQHCPICGKPVKQLMTASNFSMGWRMSDESLWVEGAPDYFVKGHK